MGGHCVTTLVNSPVLSFKFRAELTLRRSSGTVVVESLQGTPSKPGSRCTRSVGKLKLRSADPFGVSTPIRFPTSDIKQSDVIVGEGMASLLSRCGLAFLLMARLGIRKLSDCRTSEADRSLSSVFAFLVPGGLPIRALKL